MTHVSDLRIVQKSQLPPPRRMCFFSLDDTCFTRNPIFFAFVVVCSVMYVVFYPIIGVLFPTIDKGKAVKTGSTSK